MDLDIIDTKIKSRMKDLGIYYVRILMGHIAARLVQHVELIPVSITPLYRSVPRIVPTRMSKQTKGFDIEQRFLHFVKAHNFSIQVK